jgi:hypothetical protein
LRARKNSHYIVNSKLDSLTVKLLNLAIERALHAGIARHSGLSADKSLHIGKHALAAMSGERCSGLRVVSADALKNGAESDGHKVIVVNAVAGVLAGNVDCKPQVGLNKSLTASLTAAVSLSDDSALLFGREDGNGLCEVCVIQCKLQGVVFSYPYIYCNVRANFGFLAINLVS